MYFHQQFWNIQTTRRSFDSYRIKFITIVRVANNSFSSFGSICSKRHNILSILKKYNKKNYNFFINLTNNEQVK